MELSKFISVIFVPFNLFIVTFCRSCIHVFYIKSNQTYQLGKYICTDAMCSASDKYLSTQKSKIGVEWFHVTVRNFRHPISSTISVHSNFSLIAQRIMMTPSNENIFRVTGPLCGEFTGHRWIPHTKASDAEIWCLLWSAFWINGWVINREAGDLRRHHAHCDVIVMWHARNGEQHMTAIAPSMFRMQSLWPHDMTTVSRYWPLVRGIYRVEIPVGYPHKRPVIGKMVVSWL